MKVHLCWCKYDLKPSTSDLNPKSFHTAEFSDDPSFFISESESVSGHDFWEIWPNNRLVGSRKFVPAPAFVEDRVICKSHDLRQTHYLLIKDEWSSEDSKVCKIFVLRSKVLRFKSTLHQIWNSFGDFVEQGWWTLHEGVSFFSSFLCYPIWKCYDHICDWFL